MDLSKKRALAARVLGVGMGRIMFNAQRLDEIKEAITKQDMRDLAADKAIYIREIKGRHVNSGRRRRRAGSIRMKPNQRKKEYMRIARKMRAYVGELKKQEKLTNEEVLRLRKEIRGKTFKTKAHIKERIGSITKERK